MQIPPPHRMRDTYMEDEFPMTQHHGMERRNSMHFGASVPRTPIPSVHNESAEMDDEDHELPAGDRVYSAAGLQQALQEQTRLHHAQTALIHEGDGLVNAFGARAPSSKHSGHGHGHGHDRRHGDSRPSSRVCDSNSSSKTLDDHDDFRILCQMDLCQQDINHGTIDTHLRCMALGDTVMTRS